MGGGEGKRVGERVGGRMQCSAVQCSALPMKGTGASMTSKAF